MMFIMFLAILRLPCLGLLVSSRRQVDRLEWSKSNVYLRNIIKKIIIFNLFYKKFVEFYIYWVWLLVIFNIKFYRSLSFLSVSVKAAKSRIHSRLEAIKNGFSQAAARLRPKITVSFCREGLLSIYKEEGGHKDK